ncbi:MAG: DUF2007 domain-containing protein [Chloroflexi bacterium]|nr:DUF2007 domain-containing protein [Chloroflexota bacterium]MDA8188930.1 DUF2007 domain-containing protein [Dehalococcoidales bacterium]
MPKSKGKDDELVRVATAPNPVIAASWQELLKEEGIPAMVKIEDTLGVAYQVSSFYPCSIFVLATDAERAKKILDELAEEDAAPEGDSAFSDEEHLSS